MLGLVVTIVGIAGTGPADAVAIGSGGEIFARADGGWHRRGGGVAGTLVRAWGRSASDIWAVGTQLPLYHHDGTSWSAVPGTAGAAGAVVLADPGSAPGIAVGRRLYVVEGHKLVAAPAAPGPVAALWIASPRAVLAVVDGKLVRLAAGAWKPVPGADEPIVALGPKLALGLDGGVYAIEARLRKLPQVEGFRPRLALADKLVGSFGDGWALGSIAGRPSPLPGVERADEPVGLIASDPPVVVTRSGRVLIGDRAEAIEPIPAPPRPGPGPAELSPAPPASR
jgi:hypothetical protein